MSVPDGGILCLIEGLKPEAIVDRAISCEGYAAFKRKSPSFCTKGTMRLGCLAPSRGRGPLRAARRNGRHDCGSRYIHKIGPSPAQLGNPGTERLPSTFSQGDLMASSKQFPFETIVVA